MADGRSAGERSSRAEGGGRRRAGARGLVGAVARGVVGAGALVLAACGGAGPLPPGVTAVDAGSEGGGWQLGTLDAPRAAAVFRGRLFVVHGDGRTLLTEVVPAADGGAPRLVDRGVVDPGAAARTVEAGPDGLYVLPERRREIRRIDPDGAPAATVALARRDRMVAFDVRPDGSLVSHRGDDNVGFALEVRDPGRDGFGRPRPWGHLPADRSIVRINRGGGGTAAFAHTAVDGQGRVHAYFNHTGEFVQFDPEGDPLRIGRLPAPVEDAGVRSARPAYGEAGRAILNGLEATCDDELVASVGDGEQTVVWLDADDYGVRREARLDLAVAPRARWVGCGPWLLGVDPGAGAAVLVHLDAPG